jgi:hypothetical protein
VRRDSCGAMLLKAHCINLRYWYIRCILADHGCADSSTTRCVSHTTDDPSGLTHAVRGFVQVITSVPTQGEISMVHPSSRFYRCLCRLTIASMLFQTGCFSTRTKYTHNPSHPKPALLESGVWNLEVELRDGSLIKVTPLILQIWGSPIFEDSNG